MVEQRFQQHAGPGRVGGGVLGGLVHALADAHPRRQVDDRVDVLERAAHDLRVAHIAGDQLRVAGEVLGPLGVAVHLLDEAVEHAHAVARAQQPVHEMQADEPGSAGDQDLLGH